MNLRILLPTHVMLDRPVTKIVAEAENGSFCLLPRHVDFLTALVPGLLVYTDETGREQFVAVDEGLLVKHGPVVTVTTSRAIAGSELGDLRRLVREEFESLGDRERVARTAMARLESDFVRRFLQLKDVVS